MAIDALEEVLLVANQFDTHRPIIRVAPHGNGNVNDTYIALADNGVRHILQRVNTRIFTSPEIVMSNMHKATQHIQQCIEKQNLNWKVQKIIPAKEGTHYVIDVSGKFWRMISFIEESHSFDILGSHEKALELGKAVGLFHRLMSQIPQGTLTYVLKDFHVVPNYLRVYDQVIQSRPAPQNANEQFAYTFIKRHREKAIRLEEGAEKGILPLRIIHGDLKINNIMFDLHNDAAISIIDLDTVQPGLIHYDIGDCMRSSCNPTGEETQTWKEVRFDTETFQYIWRGYLENASSLMRKEEYTYIYDAVFAITFEIGLRFFTDYLEGDTYFKIHYPENNLYRGLVQFQLAQSILNQKEEIETIVYQEVAKNKRR